MAFKIYPYKMASKSARDIARGLRVKRIVPNGGYRPSNQRTKILNWGASSAHFTHNNWINKPSAVAIASNKLSTFQKLKALGLSIPLFTSDRNEAEIWQEEGHKVVCRHKLSAHSGQGIVVCRPEDTLPYAPLYTQYAKKDKEYRIHVFGGRVIDFSEKRRRLSSPPTNELIRSHLHGWIFCRDGAVLPDGARSLAVRGVGALGLDFGAVDLIEKNGRFWILEVNCAPGAEGVTLQKYIQEIKRHV
jgi:glutathione synthase/RimK-type ligase-like ATP-grasp enzyme